MEKFDRNKHWENIYQTKKLEDVSWFQPTPETSLEFIKESNIPTTAKIIDVGGGDSFLVDHLLDLGYSNVTVLDISKSAIARAKERLGDKAKNVTWIVSDIVAFRPQEKYDFWHDRAAFHFLTEQAEIKQYVETVSQFVYDNGLLVIGTFSEKGPTKCSGIEVKQYSELSMTELFKTNFERIKCKTVDHSTPFNTTQNFVFCIFKKLGY